LRTYWQYPLQRSDSKEESDADNKILAFRFLWIKKFAQSSQHDPQQASSPSGTVSEQAVDAAAKDAAQNPVAAAISVPFQNNTY
jgi:hypothetical protein